MDISGSSTISSSSGGSSNGGGSSYSSSSSSASSSAGPWCFSSYAIPGNLIGRPSATASALDCWKSCSGTSNCIASTWFYINRANTNMNMWLNNRLGTNAFNGLDAHGTCALFQSILCPSQQMARTYTCQKSRTVIDYSGDYSIQ